MRKHLLAAFAVLPLLVNLSHAAQLFSLDASEPFGIPSEDAGTSSYLGVDIADISSERLGALKLKEEKGVEVTMVDQDAPAGKAGLKEHDVILTMNGAPVESKSQLQRMIHETPAGRVVALGLSRDGAPMTIKVQLADRRNEFARLPWKDKEKDKDFKFDMSEMPEMHDFDVPNIGVVYVHSSMRSGLMVENLTPQLGEFFGAKNGHGVLIRSVEKGSRADKAGLRAGDIVVKVGDQAISDTSDFTHALRSRTSGAVNVEVIRDKKPQTLNLTLPERKESGAMIEESRDEPEIDAEDWIEISDAQDEIAKLQPQIEIVKKQIRKTSKTFAKSVCNQEKLKDQAEK